MLNRDQILGANDAQVKDVPVPEWGGSVRVKVLSGAERDAFEGLISAKAKLGQLSDNMRATIVAACVVDDAGRPLFTEADIEALGRKNWKALDRVADAASELNKLTDSDVEEIRKNSAPSPDGPSTSD